MILLMQIDVIRAQCSLLGYEDDDVIGSHLQRFPRRTGRGPALNTSECDLITDVPEGIRNSMNLDTFYQKYTHAYGVPVMSSSNPSDAALTRGCYTVRFLLADRQELRDAMHDAYGRVGIIGLSEKTTDIPEHSYLPDFWNERARGLGGTPRIPVTTNAEENLLCHGMFQDRWYEEDVLVHEFTHAIHLIAVNQVDPTWKDRLANAYRNAKEKGLWQHTYAISRSLEYFAEGVQAYFSVQTHRTFVDMVHNDISTREALREYDPELYEVIREIFPCENEIVKRCNNQTEIDWQPMLMDCNYVRHTTTPAITDFKITTSTEGSTRLFTTVIPSQKVTTSSLNGATSSTNVPEVTDCKDDAPFCEEMATVNECTYNDVIREMCLRSCHSCGGCHDYKDLCSDLAEREFCKHRETYMSTYCRKSCQACK
ncbi:uncharacterized protein LOC119740697 [Patiria miniata]|uniref:ShKT domain-containing protein n=1 Tax=Patiria miniata TaxID=46514 RepID=A0A914B994_PATMI|nr:uncharacterized protein LOC119740697 [Patiria miniata]